MRKLCVLNSVKWVLSNGFCTRTETMEEGCLSFGAVSIAEDVSVKDL